MPYLLLTFWPMSMAELVFWAGIFAGFLLSYVIGLSLMTFLVGFGLSWAFVWLFMAGVYKWAERAWREVSERFGLEFESHDGGPIGVGQVWNRKWSQRLLPTRREFELAGTLDGKEFHVYVDPDPENTTVWTVDCGEFLPEWLKLRPSGLEASLSRWVDLDDVTLGHERLDNRVVLGGASADEVREFIWKHDLAGELDALLDAVGAFEIGDGWIRRSVDEAVVRSGKLGDHLERVRTVANRLEAAVESASREQQERADKKEAVHVYE